MSKMIAVEQEPRYSIEPQVLCASTSPNPTGGLAVHSAPTPIYSIATVNSMRWLFTGGADGWIRKYDFIASMNGRLKATQNQSSLVDSVNKAAIQLGCWENEEQPQQLSANDTTQMTDDEDHNSLLTQPATSNQTTAKPKLSPVFSLACHSEAVWALSGLRNGSINLWTVRHDQGHCAHVFQQHSGPVSVLSILPDERRFLSGSWDRKLILWDLDTGAALREFHGHSAQITSLTVNPQNPKNLFLSSGLDGQLCVWDLRVKSREPVNALIPSGKIPPWSLSACWTAEGRTILCGRRNGLIDETDVASGRPTGRQWVTPNQSGPVSCVYLLPSGTHFISGSNDNLRLWDLSSSQTSKFHLIRGHRGGVVSALFVDPEERFLISCSGSRGFAGYSELDYSEMLVQVKINKWTFLENPENVARIGIRGFCTHAISPLLTPTIDLTQTQIRLIEQFLAERNLPRTLATLQEESGITLNTVDNLPELTAHIHQGHWDTVLRIFSQLRLPDSKLLDLYEQIILELMESRDFEAARTMLRQTEIMQQCRDHQTERYLHLENLLSRSDFDPREAYGEGQTKAGRRAELARQLGAELHMVSGGRLMALIGQALRWQYEQGLLPADMQLDLFRGTATTVDLEQDLPPNTNYATIKFGKKHQAEAAAFSSDGQMIATGTVDGFVELWNYTTGQLKTELKYQTEDRYMCMEHAILSLAFSRDSEWLAAGSQSGQIKIWRVSTGICLRAFDNAHSQGVTSLQFSVDGTQILSTGFDSIVRIHGLRSGKMLKEFRGHNSFVNSAIFTLDGTKIVSGSSDGTIRVWEVKTTHCSLTIRPESPESGVTPAVTHLICMPKSLDQILVCSKSSVAFIIDLKGQIIKRLSNNKPKGSDFTCCCLSAHGEYGYFGSEDGVLYSFRLENAELEMSMQIHESADVIGVVHHPQSNILASYADDGLLKLWKP